MGYNLGMGFNTVASAGGGVGGLLVVGVMASGKTMAKMLGNSVNRKSVLVSVVWVKV